jgi:FkbM family methyltransferase
MLHNRFIDHWLIRINRYIFRKQYMRVMAGPLKGYLWNTSSSYDYLLGQYEDPATLQQFIAWLKPGSVLYDIGANVGYHSLLANRFATGATVYAFEPMPFVREIFETHIRLNKERIGINNIRLLPVAIADAEKEVEFSNDPAFRDGNTYISQSCVFNKAAGKIRVQCNSIDILISQGYKVPDIIKIDVEGAEYDVLLGARKTLTTYHPHILLATHDCHLPGVQQKCIDLLKDLGYELKHTGRHNKHMAGLDDYIAKHKDKI